MVATHISDHTLRHLASHLHAAGRLEQLHRLLVGERTWMEVKLARLGSTAACAEDLELAIGELRDPLTPDGVVKLAELHMALHLVSRRVGLYSDQDLKTLVWLGRREEALGHARLRGAAGQRFEGLMAICQADLRQAADREAQSVTPRRLAPVVETELIEEPVALVETDAGGKIRRRDVPRVGHRDARRVGLKRPPQLGIASASAPPSG